MRFKSQRDSFRHLAPGPSQLSPLLASLSVSSPREYDDVSSGNVNPPPELERLSEQKHPSPEAVEIVARVSEIAGDSKITCAWIIGMCLPDGAQELKEGCAYSLRQEVYHWLQRENVRIVGEGEYAQAARATVGTPHMVRPLREVLKREFEWDPPPSETVKPKASKGPARPTSSPSITSPSILFDSPPAPEPYPAAPPSPPTAPAEIKVPGATEEVRLRRRRIVDMLKSAPTPATYDMIRRSLEVEDGVLHNDLRTLVRAGLIESMGQRGERTYQVTKKA